MVTKKRILIAPLNWGLGHAARCVPIIHQLLALDAEVVVGAHGNALAFLKLTFPNLNFIDFKGIHIKYPKNGALLLHFALRIPSLFRSVKKENLYLKKVVREHKIDGVISDNRYGVYHRNKPSVIITHQLYIESPIFKKTLQLIIKRMIHRFNECWVPDFSKTPNLSGKLSHSSSESEKIKFIGPLSRYTNSNKTVAATKKILILLSGPEPHRSILEKKLISELSSLNLDVMLVRGILTENQSIYQISKVSTVDYLLDHELEEAIKASELIICRSGYSTIMDLIALGKKALLIPTPGQPEQEYLAQYLSQNKCFVQTSQKHLNLQVKIDEAMSFTPKFTHYPPVDFKYLEHFLEKC